MKHTPIIILFVLLSLGCGNKNNTKVIVWADEDSSLISEGAINTTRDTVKKRIMDNVSDISSINNPSDPVSTSTNNEDDNMRGFDPASEDDMHDNGMNRYMENNDGIGWE